MSDVSAQQVALAAIKSTPLLNALNRWIPVVCEVQRRILSAGRARSRTDVIGPAGLRRAIGLAGLRRPAGGEKFWRHRVDFTQILKPAAAGRARAAAIRPR